ncbi:MAG: dolichyl-phosphate-mannose--protein mannosyltransferase [Arachnia sp.]
MAFGLRFYGLAFPNRLMFDETYYAKDAWTMYLFGYEKDWVEGANDQIVTGDLSGITDKTSFVVHPPLGKLLIGWGEALFGMNSFGWRIAACVFGALLVMFTIRLARRLSRYTLVGAIAGILLTFDGLAFVMSRIALLDIFQATFIMAAVAALVADRDWFRHRLAGHLRDNDLPDLGGAFGPMIWWRPWRIAAGIMFGAAVAVKWNSLYVLAVFGIVTVVWDLGARRLAGASRKAALSVVTDAPLAFIQLVVVAVPVYLTSWYSWLTTPGGWDRDFGAKNPDDPVVRFFGEALGSLWHYHTAMYDFHTGDTINAAEHPYEAHPAGWLLMIRPIGIDAQNGIEPGEQGCTAVETTCLRVVSGMGTPVLWWLAAAALVIAIWWWLGKRDWRFAVPVLGVMAVWLPWFQYTERPLFFFYATVLVPFYVTGLAMVLGRLLGPAASPQRRLRAMAVGLAIALVILNFAFIYPVLTDALMTRPEWLTRMWFGTWI